MECGTEQTNGNGELEVTFIESKCRKEVEKTEWKEREWKSRKYNKTDGIKWSDDVVNGSNKI